MCGNAWTLPIVISRGLKYIEDATLRNRLSAVWDASGNYKNAAWHKVVGLPVKLKLKFSFKKIEDLFVRMLVFGQNGIFFNRPIGHCHRGRMNHFSKEAFNDFPFVKFG